MSGMGLVTGKILMVHLADVVRKLLSGAMKTAVFDRSAQGLLVHHGFVISHGHTRRGRVRFGSVNAVKHCQMAFDSEMIEFLEQPADLEGHSLHC